MKKKAVRKAVKKQSAKRVVRKAANANKHTMREFNAKRAPAVRKYSPKQIQAIREKERVSQPVFAAYLNISASTIKKWETGEKKPQGASLKLLNVVAKEGIEVVL